MKRHRVSWSVNALAGAVAAVLSVGIASALEIDQPLNFSQNFETNTGPRQWTVWSFKKPASNYTLNTNTVQGDDGSPNQVLVLDVVLSGTGYFYVNLANPHNLVTDTTPLMLGAKLKVEVINDGSNTGTRSDLTVDYGYPLDYPAFSRPGRVAPVFRFDSSATGWQSKTVDARAAVQSDPEVSGDGLVTAFALSRRDDFLPLTAGPSLFLRNTSCGDNGCTRSLHVRISIDDVTEQGTIAGGDFDCDGNVECEPNLRRNDYLTRVSTRINDVYGGTDEDLGAIGVVTLPPSALATKLATEYGELQSAQSALEASAAVRTLGMPSGADFERELRYRSMAANLRSSAEYIAAHPTQKLIVYPWEATGYARLTGDSLAGNKKPNEALTVKTALDKYEPISFAVQNLFAEDIVVQSIDVSGLLSPYGDELPASAFDVRVVKSWFSASGANTLAFVNGLSGPQPELLPELLLKNDALVEVDRDHRINRLNDTDGLPHDISSAAASLPITMQVEDAATLQSFTIPSLEARQLWLTLNTHGAVVPGKYDGDIVVHYSKGGVAQQISIPTTIDVLPLRLGDTPLKYSLYYRSQIDGSGTGKLGSDHKTETQYRAELANIQAHGVAYPTQYIGATTGPLVDDYLRIRRDLEMPCDRLYLLGGMASLKDISVSTAGSNTAALVSATNDDPRCLEDTDVYLYGEDEGTGAAFAREKPLMNKVHETVHGKTFVAGRPGAGTALDGALDTLVMVDAADRFGAAEQIAEWTEGNSGRDIFSYGHPNAGVADPYVYRRNFGLYLTQHGFTGAMDYAYQHASASLCAAGSGNYCSAWNDADSKEYQDLVFTYPTSSGVIDTVQWEGFREGIDDTRYRQRLLDLIGAHGGLTASGSASLFLDALEDDDTFDPVAARLAMICFIEAISRAANQAPTIDATVYPAGSTLRLYGTAADPEDWLAMIEVSIDSGSWQRVGRNATWQAELTGIGSGTHTVSYQATDFWGGVTTHQQTVQVQPLCTPASIGTCTHGLTGRYYDQIDAADSQPVLIRIDGVINFDWGLDSPVPGIVPTEDFSIGWTGHIVPPVTGTYEFCTTSDDGVVLAIDGESVISHWQDQAVSTLCGSIDLVAGQAVPITLDFYDTLEEAVVKLEWSYPGQSRQIVPSSALYAQ